MTRLVRAVLTGLGAFISELIPAQTLTKAERALLSAEPPTGDTEPAGVNPPVAPAGSTNELAADLVYAAGVVRAYAVVTPDLDAREVESLNALCERLAAASKAAQ